MKAILTLSKNDASETEKIEKGFEEKLGADIEWDVKTDESIIGGFIAALGGKIYDNSVRTRLDSVTDSFLKAVRSEENGDV